MPSPPTLLFGQSTTAVMRAGAMVVVAGTGSRGSRDGPGDRAQFSAPIGLAIGSGSDARSLFVCDSGSGCMRQVTLPVRFAESPPTDRDAKQQATGISSMA